MGRQQRQFIMSITIFWILLLAAIALTAYSVMTTNYWLLLIPASFFGLVAYFTIAVRRDAAYVPTPEPIIKRMLELAEVKPRETLYDLGSGDGRILVITARDFGARAIGVEIDRSLVAASIQRLRAEKLEDRARVIEGNFFETDLRDADVVTLYLRQDTNDRLREKFKKELKLGVRVVSYIFIMTGWVPTKVDEDSRVYVYTM